MVGISLPLGQSNTPVIMGEEQSGILGEEVATGEDMEEIGKEQLGIFRDSCVFLGLLVGLGEASFIIKCVLEWDDELLGAFVDLLRLGVDRIGLVNGTPALSFVEESSEG